MGENDGLVFSYILGEKGDGTPVDWGQIRKWKPEHGVLWLHIDYTDSSAMKWLNEESGIDPVLCEALIAEETRPRVVASDDSLLLILRGVNFNPGADPEDMVALRMWFDKHRIITMRHRKVMAIEDIHANIDTGKGPSTSA